MVPFFIFIGRHVNDIDAATQNGIPDILDACEYHWALKPSSVILMLT